MLQQQPGEKLSDFLRRLEQALDRVVQRGGLTPGSADRARLEQLLLLRERKEKPPTFLQLFKEICTEEEYEASRKQIAPVSWITNKPNWDAKQMEIQKLRSEIKELKSLVASVMSKPVQDVPVSKETKTPLKAAHSKSSADSEIASLKKQLAHLQQKLNNKIVKPCASVSAVNTLKPVASSPQRPMSQKSISVIGVGKMGIMLGSVRTPKTRLKL